jgi:hypothetical protein
MNLRPLTNDDLKAWWPDVAVACSVRGFVAEHEGEIKGLAGLMYMPTALVGFAEMGPDGQQHPLTIMRMVRAMQGLMKTVSAPIFAVADEKYPNSEAFLEHVGFERVVGRQFVFRGDRNG